MAQCLEQVFRPPGLEHEAVNLGVIDGVGRVLEPGRPGEQDAVCSWGGPANPVEQLEAALVGELEICQNDIHGPLSEHGPGLFRGTRGVNVEVVGELCSQEPEDTGIIVHGQNGALVPGNIHAGYPARGAVGPGGRGAVASGDARPDGRRSAGFP